MSVSRNRKKNLSVSPYTGNRAIYEILQKSVCFQKPIKHFVSLYLFPFFPITLEVHTCNTDGVLIKQPNFYECRNSPSNTPGNLVSVFLKMIAYFPDLLTLQVQNLSFTQELCYRARLDAKQTQFQKA